METRTLAETLFYLSQCVTLAESIKKTAMLQYARQAENMRVSTGMGRTYTDQLPAVGKGR